MAITFATVALVLSSALLEGAPIAGSAIERCNNLAAADLPNITDAPTRVNTATVVKNGNGRPGYCQVLGRITAAIDIEVRLPLEGWNDKLLAVADASSGDECDQYLRRGYACLPMFRTFKKGQTDQEWASALMRDLKTRLDVNRRPHLLTEGAKGIVREYYSRSPTRSYFLGCAAGGHSAMVEAQTFAEDYDGIIAGAPNLDTADWLVRATWSAKNMLNEKNQPILTASALSILHQNVLAACDSDDGLNDGLISNPLDCRFDPSEIICSTDRPTTCLSGPQVSAINRLYAGPGSTSPNLLFGSELYWHGMGTEAAGRDLGPFFRLVFQGSAPQMHPDNYDFERDRNRLGLGAWLATPNNPDLRKFKSAGGKLIAYLGTNDTAYLTGIIDYYETVERTMGGRPATLEFFRLFLVPGMAHCIGGEGANAIDFLSYLEAWVEEGQPPAEMIAYHISNEPELIQFPLKPSTPVKFTRPVYPYPLYAKYRGTGNPKEAVNFEAADRHHSRSGTDTMPLIQNHCRH